MPKTNTVPNCERSRTAKQITAKCKESEREREHERSAKNSCQAFCVCKAKAIAGAFVLTCKQQLTAHTESQSFCSLCARSLDARLLSLTSVSLTLVASSSPSFLYGNSANAKHTARGYQRQRQQQQEQRRQKQQLRHNAPKKGMALQYK